MASIGDAVSHAAPTAPHGPVPAPPEFSGQWLAPDDEQFFWQQDKMHFPEPLTELDDLLLQLMYRDGLTHAAETYDLPIRPRHRRIGTYHYLAITPVDATPDEQHAMGGRAQERIGANMARLLELWNGEWLPEVRAHLAWWQSLDLGALSQAELADTLDESIARGQRVWRIHFVMAFPFLMAQSLFDEFYRELFGSEDAFGAYRLLQGFESKTTETFRELWTLSRSALASNAVLAALRAETLAGVVPALERSAEGRAFLAELGEFLDVYGRRGDSWGFSYPSWIEDPTPVIKNLRDYVTQTDLDPAAEMTTLANERERAVDEARRRLTTYPEQVRNQFEFLLSAAQAAVFLSEEHGHYIDYGCVAEMRRVFVEAGRRLAAAGALADADDVVHLTIDELRDAVASKTPSDYRAVVTKRKAVLAHMRDMLAPPVLGTPPAGPPPGDPVGTALTKFFGWGPPLEFEPGLLRGHAGSPGTVRARARVIRTLAEAGALQPGEVLVARTTAPPWTPLFATAAAVVTDTGGVLSHSAVVAREYGIPAVVGTLAATQVIHDGQLLEVDGSAGVVTIIQE
jgi:phosphohistidine swiveling domain-containing protein